LNIINLHKLVAKPKNFFFDEQRFPHLFKFSEGFLVVKKPPICPEQLDSVNARIEDYKAQMYTPRLRRGELDEKEEVFQLSSGRGRFKLGRTTRKRVLELNKSFYYIRLGKKRRYNLCLRFEKQLKKLKKKKLENLRGGILLECG